MRAYRMARYMLGRHEELQEIARFAKEERDLFGLNLDVNLHWTDADRSVQAEMDEKGFTMAVECDGGYANIWVDRDRLHNVYDKHPDEPRENILRTFCNHEIAHLVVNPYAGYSPLEEAQTQHISRACWMLRYTEDYVVQDPTDLEHIIDLAYHLTWLDENSWRIHVYNNGPIKKEGAPPDVYGYSTYYRDAKGWGLLGARAVELVIDESQVQNLPTAVLRELWRVVMNPYGRPNFNRMAERRLERIMKAMGELGWP